MPCVLLLLKERSMDDVENLDDPNLRLSAEAPAASLLSAARFPFLTVSVVLLIGIGALAVYLTSSPYGPRDVRFHRQLSEILVEIRTIRAEDHDFNQLRQRATVVGQQVSTVLKNEASTSTHAKQLMLWAARDDLPRMLAGDLLKESEAEQSFATKLDEAANELGIKQ